MCGRGPYDLDVSETDMEMASFQGLCSAWEAIDQDNDFPKFLAEHPLPIPLGNIRLAFSIHIFLSTSHSQYKTS
jgi:hypothetical protein